MTPEPETADSAIAAFIRANLRVAPAPLVPEIQLYTAHPGSGLRRFLEASGQQSASPYWAYPWSGGLALARYLLDNPQITAGRSVLDLGAGCGLVGIAAIKAGAASLIAADTDPHACVAARLNYELNDVAGEITGDDLLDGPAPQTGLLLIGDLFYSASTARRATAFLDRCIVAGIAVLIGDPGRTYLPRNRLRQLAQYQIPDFGSTKTGNDTSGYAFAYEAPAARK